MNIQKMKVKILQKKMKRMVNLINQPQKKVQS